MPSDPGKPTVRSEGSLGGCMTKCRKIERKALHRKPFQLLHTGRIPLAD